MPTARMPADSEALAYALSRRDSMPHALCCDVGDIMRADRSVTPHSRCLPGAKLAFSRHRRRLRRDVRSYRRPRADLIRRERRPTTVLLAFVHRAMTARRGPSTPRHGQYNGRFTTSRWALVVAGNMFAVPNKSPRLDHADWSPASIVLRGWKNNATRRPSRGISMRACSMKLLRLAGGYRMAERDFLRPSRAQMK